MEEYYSQFLFQTTTPIPFTKFYFISHISFYLNQFYNNSEILSRTYINHHCQSLNLGKDPSLIPFYQKKTVVGSNCISTNSDILKKIIIPQREGNHQKHIC